ncbi:MAG: hypothetical protein HKO02_07660 [Hyphomonadaceae bacterium]|nr:hypothetical protein [Hyphomonadaceae bacterium]
MKTQISYVTKAIIIGLPLLVLSACASTPDEPEIVEITPEPIQQGCYPIASLEKVVIPEETKTVYGSTIIESPSEFVTDPQTGETIEIKKPPVEEMQEYTVVTKEAEIIYQTPEGEVVTDICELYENTEEMIEPAPAPTE